MTYQHALRYFNLTVKGTVSTHFKERCPHCRNTSFVMPDHLASEAWPCPMCALGRARANEYATGNLVPSDSVADEPSQPQSYSGRSVASFFDGVDLTGLSWESGLTLEHRYYCSEHGCHELVTQVPMACSTCAAKADQNAAEVAA
jgi:hypothetical protein